MKIDVEYFYARTPVSIQNLIVSMEGACIRYRRFGKPFIKALRCANERMEYDLGELDQFREQRLRSLLIAAQSSPFWKNRFERYSVNIKASNPFDELQKLPILTKYEVQQNARDICSGAFLNKRLKQVHTSGTTGGGLQFCTTQNSEWELWAIWWRYRLWHGINMQMRCGYFGGRSIVPIQQTKLPYWRYNVPGRQLMLSAYHLNAERVRGYVNALSKYKTEWVHGYPSFISLLASYMVEHKVYLNYPVRFITTGSENLLDFQKEIIREAFGVTPIQHYGMAEAIANFSQRLDGKLYVDEDAAITEFIPIEGLVGKYRIIGTNIINPAFPLIRYDAGDVASMHPGQVEYRAWPGRMVDHVDGRKEDYIELPNGSKVGRLDHIFKDMIDVREAQFYQENSGLLTLRVVKGVNYERNNTESRLLAETSKRVGNSIKIKVEYLDSIARTKSGKLRFVVSEIKENKNIGE